VHFGNEIIEVATFRAAAAPIVVITSGMA